jgi:hypothetical protein
MKIPEIKVEMDGATVNCNGSKLCSSSWNTIKVETFQSPLSSREDVGLNVHAIEHSNCNSMVGTSTQGQKRKWVDESTLDNISVSTKRIKEEHLYNKEDDTSLHSTSLDTQNSSYNSISVIKNETDFDKNEEIKVHIIEEKKCINVVSEILETHLV